LSGGRWLSGVEATRQVQDQNAREGMAGGFFNRNFNFNRNFKLRGGMNNINSITNSLKFKTP
jgi:hypothetical protein